MTELISVRIRSSTPFANFTIQDLLQLTHSASFRVIKMRISESGDVEWLVRLKVKGTDEPH
jgi:hypothetical protein